MSRPIRIESPSVDRHWIIARGHRAARRRRHAVIPEAVFPLEERRLLSQTFTVTDTNSDYNMGSLNWAIQQVNVDTSDSGSSPDVIDFNIPGTGPFTIPAPGFNGINNPVVIDGYSQPGSSPNTLAQGDNAVIQIVLDGQGNAFGLLVSGGSSTIDGLAINDSGTDLELLNPLGVPPSPSYGNDAVWGCFLGTDATGEAVVPSSFFNDDTGLEINDVPGNTIGGTASADRNVISTGASELIAYGVWVTGSSSGDNLIAGNYIGTDATGNKGLGNFQGISLYDFGAGNTIGGSAASAGNVISGSVENGVIISGSANSALVQGNFIGTDAAGTAAIPNGTIDANNPGYDLAGAITLETPGNTVGGTTVGSGNLISGNDGDGIDLSFASYPDGSFSGVDSLIEGNFIGTDVTGTTSLPNQNEGIGLSSGAQYNTIGGAQAGAGNVISGNKSWGIYLDQFSGHNLIQGDFIGTNAQGTQAIANYRGVEVYSPDNTIGGATTGAGNVISGNTWGGISIEASSFDNLIQGNLIGTNVTGDTAIPNGFLSYYFLGGVMLFGSDNTVGGTTPGAGNVISGNGSDGLDIIGPYYGGAGQDNLVEGNLIGVGADGTEPLGDGASGVSIFGEAAYNTIGGLAAGAGNIIANSQNRQGLIVGGSNSDDCPGNEILSNSIYNNAVLGIDLGFNGVNQNMPGGPFQGPNDLQNYPVLGQALTYPTYSAFAVTGTLNGDASTTFTLQFFANPTADPSGHGQGQTLIGTTTVTTDPSGNASFAATFQGVNVPVGDAISATATDPLGNTSEFSADITAVAGGAPIEAVDDSYNTDINTTLTVAAPGVQANDISVLAGPLVSQLVTGPSDGSVTLNADGSFAYTPDAGFTGTDTFTYDDVADGQTSNVATVTIYVNPKTFYVTNINDSGPGSLRQALTTASLSNSPPPDTILFDIPGSGPFVIAPASPLPTLSHPTIVNGYSQPGSYTNTLATGDNAVLQIQIDGGNSGGADGLVLASGGSAVEGLSITRFNDGILVSTSGGDLITGDFIGTTPSGNTYGYGNQVGVEVQTSGNVLGGTKPAMRDVISGNNNQGVRIDDGASGNVVAGDYIGVAADGESGLGNNGGGVALYDAPANTIGGPWAGAGDVISGNGNDGVLVSSQVNGPGSLATVIQGNIIGLDANGIIALGNGNNGVEIDYGAGTLIGGTKPAYRNVISGNVAGVYLQNLAVGIAIQGNFIGTDARGYRAIGNQYDGVVLGGSDNTVGGTAARRGERDLRQHPRRYLRRRLFRLVRPQHDRR